LAFVNVARADFTMSGYQEFFAGSADQSTASGAAEHGIDLSGASQGNYSRITANWESTLDSGLNVAGIYQVNARDCSGNRQGNCGVVDLNQAAISGSFGTITVGETFDVGMGWHSRLTAGVPTGEPDGGMLGHFYTGDGGNAYGSGNEFAYAGTAIKMKYNSNIYSGFSFAAGYTPNSAVGGATDNGQVTTVTNGQMASFSDVTHLVAKYSMDMDGVGLTLTYGQQTGNAGRQATIDYNDLEEVTYSAVVSYAGLSVDYRKNEKDNSGTAKNSNTGNDEGTSVCAKYGMGNVGLGACQIDTSMIDASNYTNSAKTRTYSADYNLGGGATIGLVYFDVEQTANSVTKTDVDGIISKLSFGF